ncbi:MAG: signal peptidase I, partial [Acidimicrobiales bacterium]
WAVVVAGALAVALIIKSFLLQAYYIPSPSMEQTLVEDDRVLVNKLSKAANRGDVMVFKRPVIQQGQPEDLIKRVIATAGETVEVRGGTIYIDGKELVEPYIGEGVVTNGPVWTENCANDSSEQNSCLVPEGHIFMMGDNRGNSQDSRRFGPIDTDLVVGRAFLKVWPLGDITAL